MRSAPLPGFLRAAAAVAVVALFLFPLAWIALTSLKPADAILNKDGAIWFAFRPTLDNYAQALAGQAHAIRDARLAFADSILIALGATALSVAVGLLAAHGLSLTSPRPRGRLIAGLLLFRLVPPIALALPAALWFRDIGLFNTHLGVIVMHALLNAPLAVLLLKSFIDDIPRETLEAARLDGAAGLILLRRIIVPSIKGGIAATAVLCFLASWTEFLLSLFLSVSFRTLPVMMSLMGGQDPGPVAALATAALLPAFVFILLARGSLARGLTLGAQR
jgi:multiple sugar transport system permease protein